MTPATEDKDQETTGPSLLEKAAMKIGSVIGAVAATTGLAKHDAKGKLSNQPRVIKGKFQKSGKHRLPRKLKKMAARKADTVETAG